MIIETNNAKETFELGVQIGREAKAGSSRSIEHL